MIDRNGKDDLVVATDMDEVITNISPKWYRKIRENYEEFSNYFEDKGKLNDIDVLQRGSYYLNEWLTREDVDTIPRTVAENFLDIYKQENFYEDCTLTPMGRAIGALVEQSWCSEIHIITHAPGEVVSSKRKFIREHYGESKKLNLVCIPLDQDKSELISEIDYDMFIDDRLDLMKEVIKNTNSFSKEFLLPELGYNELDEQIIELARKNKSMLRTYSRVV